MEKQQEDEHIWDGLFQACRHADLQTETLKLTYLLMDKVEIN